MVWITQYIESLTAIRLGCGSALGRLPSALASGPYSARPPTRSLERLLTIAETADLLQVSEKTIRRRITDRSLIACKVGARWRISPRDLDYYLGRTRDVL